MVDGSLHKPEGVRLLLLLLPLFLPTLARAERLPIKAYTTADGLAHNEINKIVRDSRGFLWFCTANGLSRFDGYTFTNYGTGQGLPHANVTDFLETRSGEFWVGTYGGLVRFNPRRAGPGPEGHFWGTGRRKITVNMHTCANIKTVALSLWRGYFLSVPLSRFCDVPHEMEPPTKATINLTLF
jgi:hypothetical protein